jgi:MATE family multidrug resistance protein
MYVNLFANVCNVVLNYYLIFVLDLAVAGAAYATVIANVLGCVAMLAVQARDGIDFRRTRGHHVAGVFRLGLPSGLQFALELGAFAVMVVMLTNLSELDGAANQIAIQVIHFGFLPCVAIGEAASVMAGQAVGAGRRDLVHVVARQALLPSVGYATLMMVVFLLGGGWILVGFTSDPELLVLGRNLLYVAAAFQIADAINIVARSVLRGTGDVRYCARVGIVISWMMTPPSTWLLGYHYGLGALGGWLGLSLEIFAAAGLFWLRLNRNAWHEAADASLRELSSDGP